MKYCGQTNIPTVDNTPLDCEKFISTDCIIFEEGIPYFGFVGESTVTEVFNAVITSLTDVRSRVAIIEENASNLDHGNLIGLEDDDHTIYHTDARALTWLGTRSTSDLPEGADLYFTEPRVLSTVLAGFVAGPGTITAADSVLTALQKAQGALAAVPTKTSDLTNDGDDTVNPFINATDLPVNTNDLNNNGDDGVNPFINTTDLPTLTSELTNDGEDGVNPFISATDVATGYIPYVGATGAVNLGDNTITSLAFITKNGLASHFVKGDGSLDPNTYSTATNTSDLVNDGEDTANPFITLQDLPETADLIDEIVVGENVALGDIVYLSNDGKWWKTNADSKTTSTTEVRMSLGTILADATGTVLIKGSITLSGLTPGAKYWLDTTSGQMTTDVSGFADTDIVRYIGTALSTTEFEYNPDKTSITKDGTDINDIIITTPHPTNTSEFVNDGEDGIDPYITSADVVLPISEQLDVSAVWLSGMTFDVIANRFPVSGLWYSATQANVVLDAGHATLDRIDLIVANINGTVDKITGVPSATPAEPDWDASTYFPIKFVFVPAAAVALTQYTDVVAFNEGVDEPTEWTHSFLTTGSVLSTNDAFQGTNSMEHTPGDTAGILQLTSATTIPAADINTITFSVKLKEQYNAGIRVTLNSNGNIVHGYHITNGQYGFDKADLAWQTITIPVSNANLSNIPIDELTFNLTRNGFAGFFLDYVVIQTSSIVIPGPVDVTHPTHTSSFINDGEDGINKYATINDLNTIHFHTETPAASVWTVTHGLNTLDPIVQVRDANGFVVQPESIVAGSGDTDPDVSIITFPTATAGRATFVGSGGLVIAGSVGKYTHTQGSSSETWTATHPLGTQDVIVICYGSDGKVFQPDDIEPTDANTVVAELGSGLGDTGRMVIIG